MRSVWSFRHVARCGLRLLTEDGAVLLLARMYASRRSQIKKIHHKRHKKDTKCTKWASSFCFVYFVSFSVFVVNL
jgi:hypothetical protein